MAETFEELLDDIRGTVRAGGKNMQETAKALERQLKGVRDELKEDLNRLHKDGKRALRKKKDE